MTMVNSPPRHAEPASDHVDVPIASLINALIEQSRFANLDPDLLRNMVIHVRDMELRTVRCAQSDRERLCLSAELTLCTSVHEAPSENENEVQEHHTELPDEPM